MVAATEVRQVETPIGLLTVIAGSAGVSRVCYPGADPAVAAASEGARAVEGSRDPDQLATRAARQLEEWFAGGRRSFDLPLDLGAVTAFQRRVLEEAERVPFGETASYREMAAAAGSPGAVRAAGSAMGANPLPILVPCHRVVRSDGSMGRYGGGEAIKKWLLQHERVMTEGDVGHV